jgi:N-acyl-D-amino-acid deacylase
MVGISPPRRVNDLPGGGTRTIRDPIEVHDVYVNGVRVFDGNNYVTVDKGRGRVWTNF